jgi:glucokinase
VAITHPEPGLLGAAALAMQETGHALWASPGQN